MKLIREEKGSVTLFVLVSCMFMIMILLAINITVINRNTSQKKELDEIIKQYSQVNLDEAYAEVTKGEDYIEIGDIEKILYPVGSIYMSTNSQNPSEYLGGEWEAYGEGRTIVGVGTSDTEFKEAQTGGHSSYDMRALLGAVNSDAKRLGYPMSPKVPNYDYSYAVTTSSYVSNIPYSNVNHSTFVVTTTGGQYSALQPYVTTYMWKRVS